MSSRVDTFADCHQALLRAEHAAETDELETLLQTSSLSELEAQGLALPRLVIRETRSGLYSRTLVDFCTKRGLHTLQNEEKKNSRSVIPPKKNELERDNDIGGSSTSSSICLPEHHRFTPGDIVGIFDNANNAVNKGSKGALATGVVYKVRSLYISVAFDTDDWSEGEEITAKKAVHLVLLSSNVTIERQLKALERLRSYPPDGPAGHLLNVCFGYQEPGFRQPTELRGERGEQEEEQEEGGTGKENKRGTRRRRPSENEDVGDQSNDASASPLSAVPSQSCDVASCEEDLSCFLHGPPSSASCHSDLSTCEGYPWFSRSLLPSQKVAVTRSLRSQDIFLIHGPPGTGKSTTVVELLLQLAARGKRVLACAPSNIAVDNLLERVAFFSTSEKTMPSSCGPAPAPASSSSLSSNSDQHCSTGSSKTTRKEETLTGRDGIPSCSSPSPTPFVRSNVLTGLPAKLQRCVRLGHPARIDESLSRFSLESQLNKSEEARLSREIRRELDSNLEILRDRRKLEKKVTEDSLNGKSRTGTHPGAGGGGETGAGVATKLSTGVYTAARRAIRQEIRSLRQELRKFERKAVEEVLKQSPIVFATCAGADDEALRQLCGGGEDRRGGGGGGRSGGIEDGFDVVVIDEAAQALEAVCWIPLLYGRQGVLAGDHCQLPPTIKSREAMRDGLSITLFERLMRGPFGLKISQLLDTQFRMHKKIMQWSNVQFYHGDLKAHASVATRVLKDHHQEGREDDDNEDRTAGENESERKKEQHRGKVEQDDAEGTGKDKKTTDPPNQTPSHGAMYEVISESVNAAPPFLWIDTAGVSWLQEDSATVEGTSSYSSHPGKDVGDGFCRSRSNVGEAAIVIKYLEHLLSTYTRLDPSDICVITPYRKQVQLIRRLLNDATTQQEDMDTFKHAGSTVYRNNVHRSLSSTSVNTVDGFQGREGEVVVISLVRSNPWGEVGFLSDVRRLNVAVTRAKRHLVIIGDSETVAGRGSEEQVAQQKHGDGSERVSKRRETKVEELKAEEKSSTHVETKENDSLQRRARAILQSLYSYACDEGEIRSALEFVDICDVPARSSAEFGHPAGHPGTSKQQNRSEGGVRGAEAGEANEGKGDTRRPASGLSRAAANRKKKKEKAEILNKGPGGEERSREVDAHPSTFTAKNIRPEESTEERIRRILVEFQQRQRKPQAATNVCLSVYTFPSSLSAYERRTVHAVAEDLGLAHTSAGDGDERRVVVSLPGASGKGTQSQGDREQPQQAPEKPKREEGLVSQKAAKTESRQEPEERETEEKTDAQSYHDVNIEKHGSGCQQETGAASLDTSRMSKSRNKKKKDMCTVDEDIDALLETITKEDWTCHYSEGKCKASTKVLGRVCPFCQKRFCFSHSMPEIHGCGNAAAVHARKAFRENGQKERRKDEEEAAKKRGASSVFTNKSVAGNVYSRSVVQQRLKGKLEEEKKKRTVQKKEKK
ncbi:r3h domain-containing protein [Cystoisospora suis]|uniref:DNA helicase n=1 Tax=Cystoisospora suis TaxID=483139 RepID=A0A2C6L557_9APIC|nr:r3h domain-containing protein [Cystoisospora suis]